MWVKWLSFKFTDFVWGNGESLSKLCRSIVIYLIVISIYDTISNKNSLNLLDYLTSFFVSPSSFLGVTSPISMPIWLQCVTCLVRLVFVGLFIAILVKRHNKR